MKARRALLGTLALVLGVVCGRLIWPDAPLAPPADSALAAGPVDFRLHDQHGQVVDAASLRGRVALVFFGYTFCPDVCPTSLFEMQRVQEGLGGQAEGYRGIFITVDPERDTAARLKAYLGHFHESFIGLRGTDAELAAAAQSFGAVYERGQSLGDGGYLMGHTAFGHLLDSDGRLHTVFPAGARAEEMLPVVRHLLAGR